MTLVRKCSQCHKNAVGYLYAAGSLLTEMQLLAADATDKEKVSRLARSVAAKEFPRRVGHSPQESIRFLSAVTNKGTVLFEKTAVALSSRLYLLEDPWGAASTQLLKELRAMALQAGYDVIVCSCPLFPFTKIDHLFVPELGLGFVTQNKFHPITLAADKTIHARRFTDMEKIRARKHRITFLTRAAKNMLDQSAGLIGEAKRSHDQLEQYYIAATDFALVEEKTKQTVARFLALTGSK